MRDVSQHLIGLENRAHDIQFSLSKFVIESVKCIDNTQFLLNVLCV